MQIVELQMIHASETTIKQKIIENLQYMYMRSFLRKKSKENVINY